MLLSVSFLVLAPRVLPPSDSRLAALAIGHAEAVELRQSVPDRRVVLDASGGLTRADLVWLRTRLGLSEGGGPHVTIDFGPARRLGKGRLAADASVVYGPRGGFRAHYVVRPGRGPYGAVEKKTVFMRY